MRMYDPQDGVVTLDERFLDEDWMKGHIAGVSQQGASRVIILDGRPYLRTLLLVRGWRRAKSGRKWRKLVKLR